ncbi:MAG: hypothetical protein ACIAQZ_16410 [Sedimentisphaeraceae bacterium JB056]
MSRSKENILEQYAHFIILGVAGLVAAALLFKFVIMSPNSDDFMGQTVTPSNVDETVKDYSRRIESGLQSDPEPKGRYASKAPKFESLLDNSLEGIELSYFTFPGEDSAATESLREYAVPELPSPKDMVADDLRTVAHVPVVQLQIEDSYDTIATNVEDVDVVTVQATVDMTSLYESFERTFAGRSLKAQWRDPALAKVIFAGVQLQRQELVAGQWTDWQVVPRTKIDKYSNTFSEVYGSDDPSSAEILMPQFIIPELWKDSLQPPMYDVAQLDFNWYPPALLGDYQKELENLEKERQRAEREASRTSTRDRRDTRDRRTTTPNVGGGDMGGMGMPGMGGMGGGMPGMDTGNTRERRTRDTRRTTREETPSRVQQSRDFDREYNDLLIGENEDLSRLRDDVVVWAHDDTVEPGKTYRYRLRYGVFNPVAGKGWYPDEYSEYNDQIVLWSQFTDVTDPFHIDLRQYIFPTGVKANGVVVKVAKLNLGNWQTHDFFVNPGEFIGYEVEQEKKVATTTRYNRDLKDNETETETVDYYTGIVFLDLVDVKDWELAGVVKERTYQSMVYSEDNNILSLPTKDRFWPQTLVDAQKMINSSSEKIVEISTDRNSTGRSTGGMGGEGMGMPGMGMPGMGMPGMGM